MRQQYEMKAKYRLMWGTRCSMRGGGCHRHLVSTSNEALNQSHNLVPHPVVLDVIEAVVSHVLSNTRRMASLQTPYILFGCGDVGGRKVKLRVSHATIVL